MDQKIVKKIEFHLFENEAAEIEELRLWHNQRYSDNISFDNFCLYLFYQGKMLITKDKKEHENMIKDTQS